jgi:hypothetical protein
VSDDRDESVLVLLVQSGDVAAFERLLMRLYQPLRSYVFKMVGTAISAGASGRTTAKQS